MEFVNSIAHAKNGEEALTLYNFLKPDLILLDIKIPIMNGIEVLKNIRKNDQQTSVIVLTNYPEEQYRIACTKLGANYFFDKSTEFGSVEAAIRSLQNKK